MCRVGGIGGNWKWEYSRWKEQHTQMYGTVEMKMCSGIINKFSSALRVGNK